MQRDLLNQTVGNIRIEALLGRGGMGEVYRGFDTRLERRVAVKTIRAEHRLEPEMKTRFLREARILSKLEHPAICQVYDLIEGTDADYLIFEFVEGQTLERVIEERRLEQKEALEICEKVMRALSFAHRERIVHRDLKPANLMITAGGAIKILDFGISRAVRESTFVSAAFDSPAKQRSMASSDLHTELVEAAQRVGVATTGITAAFETVPRPVGSETLQVGSTSGNRASEATLTITGVADPGSSGSTFDAALTQAGAVVGTVSYMSPEQATGEEVDEASDLYSLGIMLQEMLTNRPAYPPASTPFQLLALVARAETLPFRSDDADVTRLVEDLKHPQPNRRPSALEAADRIRFVLERPERERRQRWRWLATASALVLLTVISLVVSVLAIRANREATRANREATRANLEAEKASLAARQAEEEALRAQEITDFLVDLFNQASPENARGRSVTAVELVDLGAQKIETELAAQPVVQARLQDSLGTIYHGLGELEKSEALIRRALETRDRELGSESLESARSRGHLALVRADRGEFEEAEQLFNEALSGQDHVADFETVATLSHGLATIYLESGQLDRAEPVFRQMLEIGELLYGKESSELINSLNSLAILAWQKGRFSEAEALYRRSIAIQEKKLGMNHPDLAALLNNLGILCRDQGRLEEAEALSSRALAIAEKSQGPNHPGVALILFTIGKLELERTRLVAAKAAFERALAIHRKTRGSDHYEVGRTLAQLADVARLERRFGAAKDLLLQAEKLLEREFGSEHPWLVEVLVIRAKLYRDKISPEADAALTRALERARAVFGAESAETQKIRQELEER